MTGLRNGAAVSFLLRLEDTTDKDLELYRQFVVSILPVFYEIRKTSLSSTWTWLVCVRSLTRNGRPRKSLRTSIRHYKKQRTFYENYDLITSRLLTILKQWEEKQPVSVSLTLAPKGCVSTSAQQPNIDTR